jgi:hypothetical protein
MGMDLRPVNSPKYVSAMTENGVAWDDEGKWGRYNIDGWSDLLNYLRRKGFARRLPVFNDGELIPAAVCRRIADLLDLAEGEDSWAREHASWWRTCGGCFVF